MTASTEPLDVTIITGMSGAGRSEAARRARGPRLLRDRQPAADAHRQGRRAGARRARRRTRYALVVDVRSGDVPRTTSSPRSPSCARTGARTRVLFLDAADDVLVRRYEASRRRHPLARRRPRLRRHRRRARAARGRSRARPTSSSTRRRSTCTSCATGCASSSPTTRRDGALQISVVSFGYKHGLPLDVDLVFDCRFLPNPHWVEELRPLDRAPTTPVRDYVLGAARDRARSSTSSSGCSRCCSRRTSARARRTSRSASAAPAAGTAASSSPSELGERLRRARLSRRGPPPGRRPWLTALARRPARRRARRRARSRRSRCAPSAGTRASITAVVSVADDGGSSGRLRRDLGVPAPGRPPQCLVALAGDDDACGPRAFEHRFATGELDGHALGNLVLVGLTETLGDLAAALDEAGRLLGAVGRVLPATVEPVVLKAERRRRRTCEGQVAVPGRGPAARHPPGRPRPRRRRRARPTRSQAIARGRPGRARPGLALHQPAPGALRRRDPAARSPRRRARVVQVGNLRPQMPETAGLDGTDHLAGRPRPRRAGSIAFLLRPRRRACRSTASGSRASGVEPVAAPIARPDGLRARSVDSWRRRSAALL